MFLQSATLAPKTIIDATQIVKICLYCEKKEDGKIKLLVCGKCKASYFCSRQHLKESMHSQSCKPIAKGTSQQTDKSDTVAQKTILKKDPESVLQIPDPVIYSKKSGRKKTSQSQKFEKKERCQIEPKIKQSVDSAKKTLKTVSLVPEKTAEKVEIKQLRYLILDLKMHYKKNYGSLEKWPKHESPEEIIHGLHCIKDSQENFQAQASAKILLTYIELNLNDCKMNNLLVKHANIYKLLKFLKVTQYSAMDS